MPVSARPRPSRLTRSFALVFALWFCVAAGAQSSIKDIEARLKKDPVLLRGQWGGNSLQFDAQGHPQKNYPVVPFTLSVVAVQSVQQKGDGLLIEGQRQGLEFEAKFKGDPVMKRVPLTKPAHGKISIEIAGSAGADYTAALGAVFLPDLASAVPQMPAYWQRYARAHFLPHGAQVATATPVQPPVPAHVPEPSETETKPLPLSVESGASVPKIVQLVEPGYTEEAQGRLTGNVELYLWVGEDGSVSHVEIAKPLGLGLDERAIDAVMKYKFVPAKLHGKPVKTDLYIDINFQFF
jgi:TonB family protein